MNSLKTPLSNKISGYARRAMSFSTTGILILVVVVGLFSPMSRVNADATTGTCTYTATNKTTGAKRTYSVQAVLQTGCVVGSQTSTATETIVVDSFNANGTQNTSASIDGAKGSELCKGVFGDYSPDCLFVSFLELVSAFILRIAALILWMAGIILNYVLKYTIVDMSEHINGVSGVGGLKGINIAWKVMRDLMNICFIFLLVYEATKLIIGQSTRDKVKKMVTYIVIASLLVNFSLFFTKVLIDASNIATIGFYDSILNSSVAPGTVPCDPTPTPGCVPGGAREAVSGLSVPFMNSLGLADWYSVKSFEATVVGGDLNLVIFNLLGAVLFIIVSFVFFAVTCLFIIRYITLVVLLMLSPIAFMGWALPFMHEYSMDWWKSLNGQLLFAPIYMLLTWVVLTLISPDNGFLTGGGNWGSLLNGTGGSAGSANDSISLIFNFVVIIGLIITTLVISKKTATRGSSLIGQASGKVTAFAGGAILGGAGMLGRQSLGRMGMGKATTEELEARVAQGGLQGQRARARLAMAKGSYDMRRSTGGEALSKATGVNLGRGTEGIPFMGNAKAGEGGRAGAMEEEKKKEKANQEAINKFRNTQALEEAKKAIDAGSKDGATQDQKDAMEKALAKLSDKQTETLVAENRKLLESLDFANAISVKQLEALNKSEQFSEEDKTHLKNNRFEQIKTIHDPTALTAYATATAVAPGARTATHIADIKRMDDARSRVKGLSDSELEMIDTAYLDPTRIEGREFISQLKDSQVENIATNKGGKFTTSQKNNVRDERMRPLKDALASGSVTNIQREIRKADYKTLVRYMKVAGRGGVNIALDPAVLPLYTSKTLRRMAGYDDMTDTDIDTLRTALLTHGSPATQAWLLDADKGMIDFPSI
ncbi:MAG TPA: hypothetical protein VJG67_04060 [Candidatus Paceibacterota bacterium]